MSNAQASQNLRLVTPAGVFSFPYLLSCDVYEGESSYKTKFLMPADDPEVQAFVAQIEAMVDERHAAAVAEMREKHDKEVLPKAQAKWKEAAARAKSANRNAPAWKEPPFEEPKRSSPIVDQGHEILIRAKLKSGGVNRTTGESFEQRPRLWDASRNEWNLKTPIFSGAEGKLWIEVIPFFKPSTGAGVTFRLRGALIEKLPEKKAFNPFASGSAPAGGNDETQDESDLEIPF